ncbi:hypothetical protein [Xylanimonas ulmi]|uniref:Uncharacterized protein n=1 Tax=Xylanimonas ulmi TaxID=228973 RepID=A0A4Q7M0H9_9MICO|nr:hypothetical protein [Xylanibacterium ulmi]RZS60671.1 hypothetical protein EV386_0943 [Xylanibacterium ulmi]
MRFANRPSWSLRVGDDHMLSAALWIRDATGLVVESDDVPPPLLVRPPASAILDGEDLKAVGRDWLRWWRALVAIQLDRRDAPPQTTTPNSSRKWIGATYERLVDTGDPFDGFAGLAWAPALQRACVGLFPQTSRARTAPTRFETETPWTLYRQVVHGVAAAHALDPNVLSGDVLVTPTGGGWWRVLGPGFVITSDDAPAEDVVRAAIESRL